MRTPGGNDYNLRLIRFPATIYGATVLLDDGTYDVFINELLCDEARRKTLHHEIEHIDRGHLYDDCRSIITMECEARGESAPVEEERAPDEKRLPDVLTQSTPGVIPLFYSLDHMGHYVRAYCEQLRREGTLPPKTKKAAPDAIRAGSGK